MHTHSIVNFNISNDFKIMFEIKKHVKMNEIINQKYNFFFFFDKNMSKTTIIIL